MSLDSRQSFQPLSSCHDVQDVSSEMLATPFGRAKWVSLPTFFDSFLPGLPAATNLDALMRKLTRQKTLSNRILTKSGILWGYAKRKPADFNDRLPGVRSNVFKHLYACADKLVRTLPLSTQRYRLIHNDKNAWDSVKLNQDSLPDAYFCPVDDDGVSPTWRTIAVSGAYMLDDCYGASLHVRTHCVPSSSLSDSFEQNMRKVTRAMAKCMLKDPRRRFTYGYTIEYSEMRLWYCDRANIVMSQAFDFTSVSRAFLTRDV